MMTVATHSECAWSDRAKDLESLALEFWPLLGPSGFSAPTLYRSSDFGEVTDLFTEIVRELAPPGTETIFSEYVSTAIVEEFSRLIDHYEARSGAFVIIRQRSDGRLAATGGFEHVDASQAELRRIYVDPAFRCQGIGRALVLVLERLAASVGATSVVLNTSELQKDAIRLYLALGYGIDREEHSPATTASKVGGLRRFFMSRSLGSASSSV
jgi:GNAT superfamily N-acetyltransferase